MLSRSIMVKAICLTGFGSFAMAMPAAAQGYTQEQQQLCSGDAFRLCGPDIPNVDLVRACMIRQRAQLSPGCLSVFRADPVVAARPVLPRASRPVALKNSKAAASAKARKAKQAPR